MQDVEEQKQLTIVYAHRQEVGWHPVSYMARLAAELFDARLITVSPGSRRSGRRLLSVVPRRVGRRPCLLIAPEPRDLVAALRTENWLMGYERLVAWVIDSFWHEKIPSVTARQFDSLFVSGRLDVDAWGAAVNVPVSWLPWGSDVFRLGSGSDRRPTDIQRVGRQPVDWEDDQATALAAERWSLTFAGRPEMLVDEGANQRRLMDAFAQTKFVLAFSNKAAPAPYTHPHREYITARWTDALAAGASVAGVAPVCPETDLLWPGATVHVPITRDAGIEVLAEYVRAWHPGQASRNHFMALQRLDWRHRFLRIADELELHPPRLHAELQALNDVVASQTS